jgi:hypothetical protein
MTTPSTLDFRLHAVRGGSEEFGRVDFHRMLTALVVVQQPTATEVRADPGDWGIDTFVGSLIDTISIWQSKYFYGRIEDSQKAQIRESFASAMKHAAEHGYKVESWTLCVATTLSAPERQWWDGKVRAWRREHPRLRIDLWDEPRLRSMLISPDAEHVFREFYGPDRNWSTHPVVIVDNLDELSNEPLSARLPSATDVPAFADALFMRQLEAAAVSQVDAQRLAFFSADLLARDISARGVRDELDAWNELDHEVEAIWEEHWIDPALTPTAADYEPSARRLLSAVLGALRTVATPPVLPVQSRHVRGAMHRVVEDGRAGWVYDWRDLVAAHLAVAGSDGGGEAVPSTAEETLPAAPAAPPADAVTTSAQVIV